MPGWPKASTENVGIAASAPLHWACRCTRNAVPACCHSGVLGLLLLAGAIAPTQSYAQTYVLTPPTFETVDENLVSLMSGRTQINVPAVAIGDLTFKTYNTTGIGVSLYDENYGRAISCLVPAQYGGTPGMSGECAAAGPNPTVQAILGKERANFSYISGQYVPEQTTGETFVDAGGYCTWTRKNGRQVKYYAIHPSGSPLCIAANVAQIIEPNGKIIDYHYSGSTAGTAELPILSLTSSDGFMLKYNYSSTPTVGTENSVLGINRAFQACDPDALTCSTSLSWPTGTVLRQAGPGAGIVYKVTVTSQKNEKYVFGLDSMSRLVSYQPPGADTPLYTFTLCTPGLFDPGTSTTPLTNCFGHSTWHQLWNNPEESAFFDQVQNVTKNGQTWYYSPTLVSTDYPPYMRWRREAHSPLGIAKYAWGSATPNYYLYGATVDVSDGAGNLYSFARGINNPLVKVTTGDNGYSEYFYDSRNNVTSIVQHASSGSATISRTASYPATCSNMKTCNKPDYYIDAKGNRTDLTYDANHGGVLTETGPAVNGVRPQKRYTYVQRYAWYLNASGVMTRETRPVWLLASESHCISSAAASSGTGCTAANDEVVTTYDYGPDSGPNNLLVRGQAVTWNGQTRRTCFGHDRYGNKIWESAPKAAPASCPSY